MIVTRVVASPTMSLLCVLAIPQCVVVVLVMVSLRAVMTTASKSLFQFARSASSVRAVVQSCDDHDSKIALAHVSEYLA